MNKAIPISRLEDMIISLIKFPYPHICKHLVACDLLSLIEEYGESMPYELGKAIAQADDERVIELMDEYRSEINGNNTWIN